MVIEDLQGPRIISKTNMLCVQCRNEVPFVKNILRWVKKKGVILSSLTLKRKFGPWSEEVRNYR